MEMRLQGRPDSRVFKQKRQSGRYFPFCFYFLNLAEVIYLSSEYYLYQRNADLVILVRDKKKEKKIFPTV